ncbi:hypothetical protein A3L11_09450 [Thermococcus siculi]|uniref:DUF2341 domain-containing protein n=1 Tax=Thermococcus siculi TaxID=72803 RepID=A0A2Z2MPZ9_9EURY|nr:DUF2341 domain-containing protein [Thermococcus siculi]ASJ09441.1 hypothetical protein A3L11_09450 [Thermococcus siculi]
MRVLRITSLFLILMLLAVTFGLAVPSINVNVQEIGAGSCDVVSPAVQASVYIKWEPSGLFGSRWQIGYINITFSDSLPRGTKWFLNITIQGRRSTGEHHANGTLSSNLPAGQPLHIPPENITNSDQTYRSPTVENITIILLSPDYSQCPYRSITVSVQKLGVGHKFSGSSSGRLVLPVHEKNGTYLTDYAVEFNLSGSWDYPYFTDADGNRLYYWYRYDPNLNVTLFWVLMNLSPYENTSIYFYWGDAASYDPTYVDPNKIFLFFDDFNGDSLDTNKWNYHYESDPIEVSNSLVKLPQKSSIWTKVTLPKSYTVIVNGTLRRAKRNNYGPFYAVFIDPITKIGSGEALYRVLGSNEDHLVDINVSTVSVVTDYDSISNPYTLRSSHIFHIYVNSNGTVYTFEDLSPKVYIEGLTPIEGFFGLGAITLPRRNPFITFDWVALRKHVPKEPEVDTPTIEGDYYLVVFKP